LQKLPLPFDAVILGMGTDGHTASFFPGGDNLIAAVDPATKDRVISMRAQGAGEPRVTFTLPILAGAGFLALHIEGEDKLAVLDQAANDASISANAMPVRHIIRAAQQLEIYWAP
jgi:6-phosphogluconolactonase